MENKQAITMAYNMARKARARKMSKGGTVLDEKEFQRDEGLGEKGKLFELEGLKDTDEDLEGFSMGGYADGGEVVDEENLQWPKEEMGSEDGHGAMKEALSAVGGGEANEDQDRLRFLRSYLTRARLHRKG